MIFWSCSNSRSYFSSRLRCLVSVKATQKLSPGQRGRHYFIFNILKFGVYPCCGLSFPFALFSPPNLLPLYPHHPLPSATPPSALLFFLFPSPLLSLSLSVNENVLTRKKDLLGIAQFIRKAEVWKREREKKEAAGPSKKSYSCECLMRQ